MINRVDICFSIDWYIGVVVN